MGENPFEQLKKYRVGGKKPDFLPDDDQLLDPLKMDEDELMRLQKSGGISAQEAARLIREERRDKLDTYSLRRGRV